MILISLGSNMAGAYESPAHVLRAALGQFPLHGLEPVRVSPFYRTPAVGPYAQPDFINAVAEVEAALPPEALLAQLHRIEQALGRERAVRWEERIIDLDLLAFDDLVVSPAGGGPKPGEPWKPRPLELPHSGLAQRAFVLVPLADIAPDWRHPVLGLTARELLGRLDPADLAGIAPEREGA
jgi:2-amino-4-hydroxy-6-hydroxymethyldihydropteridine diphosphokinase